MAKLIDTLKDATTEKLIYEDGSEQIVDRVAYLVGETTHTEECPEMEKLFADKDFDNPGMRMIDFFDAMHDGLGVQECATCAAMRAIENYGPIIAHTTTQKENTMPVKTAPKPPATKAPAPKTTAHAAAKTAGIKLPEGTKVTPSLNAVIAVIDSGTYGTTKEIAAAAKISDAAAKSALLALESAGFLVHTTASDKAKTVTWAKKGAPVAAKKTAADLQAAMNVKIEANAASKKAAAKTVPSKAPAAGDGAPKKSVAAAKGEREARNAATAKICLDFLNAHPGIAYAVRDVELGTGNGPETEGVKTLRPALWALVEKGLVKPEKTEEGRKGFMVEKVEAAPAKKK